MAVDLADHIPAYRVETDRLLLRCWSPKDATALRQVLDDSDDHLRPWIPFMKDEPRTLAQTAGWLRGARADFDRDVAWHYAVFDRGTGGLLGGNMLNPRSGPGSLELGYWTRKGYTGQGIAAEATRAMIRVAFEVHAVDRVEIHCSPENQASAAIPAKLGSRGIQIPRRPA
jgi:RimJ/RimL family protein N-acetyltransferase